MISVCMATYNGAKFIEKQLTSILVQLTSTDEVIIVDDVSTDQTIGMIELLSKQSQVPVKILSNEENLGPIASFEKAIQHAKGEFIFLADQDDEWLLTKVSMVMRQLVQQKADLVIHDAIVIDGQGEVVSPSWNVYNHNNLSTKIWPTLLKNSYTGCMMAFTSDVARQCLPFPKEIEMHDQWLALAAMMNKNKIVMIAEPLMNYVRHGGNVTGMKKRKFLKKLAGRFQMLKAVLTYKKRRS